MEEETSQKTIELLDFWAVWCGPCKIMDPILEELESEYKDKITIRKINVDEDENQTLLGKYHVLSVPTYILLKDGEVIDSFIGVQPKVALTKSIDGLLNE